MRLSRMLFFWLLCAGGVSFGIWFAAAPGGYWSYASQWLLHQRFDAIWANEQESVSKTIVLPALNAWIADIGR